MLSISDSWISVCSLWSTAVVSWLPISWGSGGLMIVIGMTKLSERRPCISRCSWHNAHQCRQQCTMHGSQGEFCSHTTTSVIFLVNYALNNYLSHKQELFQIEAKWEGDYHLEVVFSLELLSKEASIDTTHPPSKDQSLPYKKHCFWIQSMKCQGGTSQCNASLHKYGMAYAWCSPLHIILHLLNILPKQNTRAKAAPPNCTQNLPHPINLLLMFLGLLSEVRGVTGTNNCWKIGPNVKFHSISTPRILWAFQSVSFSIEIWVFHTNSEPL